ncbi:ATP phosphoribosyltransferase regulatory subunit [Natronospora cellulosivora (SeqCode)]
MNNNNMLKSAGGMRSYLPELASELKCIERKILDIFELWGYHPIITPTLEYYESLTEGMGRSLDKRLYKFIDYEGNILTLRPEMTAPIARTLSNRLNDIELPMRLSYNATVFRYDQLQAGKNREIYQLGVEFIGEKSYLADAEAIILAIESLQNTGIEDFKLDIGHAAYLEGIIEELDLSHEIELEIKTFLNKKDLVGLNDFILSLEEEGVDKKVEMINDIPALRGNQEILRDARSLVKNEKSIAALENLEKIYQYIADYGLADYITLDLSLIRGFDYYTGVVFEGFTEKLGYTICGGGRYDNLLNKYSGQEIPAIGFAIGLERVRLALKRQDYEFEYPVLDELFLVNDGTEALAMKTAKKLRQKGIITSLAELRDNKEELKAKAKNEGVKRILIFIDKEKLEVLDIINDTMETIEIDGDWEEKLWEI